ncbi:MAG TPA: proteasome accessory factor PafA2 [Candidatus Corynebacterium gallistercoris]|uniref:Proteasome accessory factor PafA2 n=1 Tax=Candidatus Corynebacterium gallistercoris TaxID=2838530 RepID=A0A9D1RYC4_9CORY|nr:proteasome accessory factor PafA2 [Candidatus Corynebacterium gallistercoris]
MTDSSPTPSSTASPSPRNLLSLTSVKAEQERRKPAYLIGSETEFGIVAVDAPEISPIVTSTQAVVAWAEHSGQGVNRRTRWDYENESPLRDVRGFDLRRYRRGSAPVLDPNAVGAANVISANGARFYVDHAHPEYSSPEVTSARAAVVWDKAGDVLMHRAAQASGEVEGQPRLKIYKNNVDGKGASYGSHENYLYPRELDVDLVQQALIPHFVTRQIYVGAGRMGLGSEGEKAGFQISQRADYIETEVSLETTLNRGIVNTRDEPHADAKKWRRLHVIIGDANMSETAVYLKFGTTALLLKAVEHGADFSDLRLFEPVADVQRVSRDLSCKEKLRLYGNTYMTAVEIQAEIRRRILAALEPAGILTSDDRNVLATWEEILEALARDPMKTKDRLDWTAKLALMNAYRARGLTWEDPRLALVDLQYADIDPARGLYHALVAKGRMRTLVPGEEIDHAVHCPPRDTRAWLRGQLVAAHSEQILAANWDSVIVDTPFAGQQAARIVMDDPLAFTAEDVAGLFPCYNKAQDSTRPIAEVVAGLAAVQPHKIHGVGNFVDN